MNRERSMEVTIIINQRLINGGISIKSETSCHTFEEVEGGRQITYFRFDSGSGSRNGSLSSRNISYGRSQVVKYREKEVGDRSMFFCCSHLRLGRFRRITAVFGVVYALFICSKPTATIRPSRKRLGSLSLQPPRRHPTQRPHHPSCSPTMAAVVARRPLAPRAQQGQIPTIISPAATKAHTTVLSASKRARSPDVRHTHTPAGESQVLKKARCVAAGATTMMREQDARDKERRRAEREAQKEEFRIKYTKAFPSWVFYFDTAESEGQELSSKVIQLNAVCFCCGRCNVAGSLTLRFCLASGEVLLQRGHACYYEQTYTGRRGGVEQGEYVEN